MNIMIIECRTIRITNRLKSSTFEIHLKYIFSTLSIKFDQHL